MAEPILTLETLNPEQKFIRIDKVDYRLAQLSEFGLRPLAKLGALGRTLQGYEGLTMDTLDDAAIDGYVQAIEQSLDLILPDLPADVRARLPDGYKLAIVRAFTDETGLTAAEGPSQETTPPRRARRQSRASSGAS